jgi:hypothetical protein
MTRQTQSKYLITYETMIKLPYFLKVTYPIAAVMVRIHSPAVAMTAPRSIVLAVCNNRYIYNTANWKITSFMVWDSILSLI